MSDDDDISNSSSDESEAKNRKRKKAQSSKAKKKTKESFIDDSAILSGSDEGEDEEEEEEDDDDEYEKNDGFIVDEAEDDEGSADLEDSGSDDSDDDSAQERMAQKRTRVRLKKGRYGEQLDEDDLDLIHEARGDRRRERRREQDHRGPKVRGRDQDELRGKLFQQSDDERDGDRYNRKDNDRRRNRARQEEDLFDEENLDDFIDDDLGDQDEVERSGGARTKQRYDANRGEGVTEDQMIEANAIFGDFAMFMGGQDNATSDLSDDDDGRVDKRDGDSEADETDDDDMFHSDDDTTTKRSREQKRKEKKERRASRAKKKAEQRRKQLTHAFEPRILIENFCTERDDNIRNKDIPERYIDWIVPYHDEDKEEEANWIVSQVRPITKAFYASDDENNKRGILVSIQEALKFMHKDKLEPEFIKRYRADLVTCTTVRENLHHVFDKDGEWERMTVSKKKVGTLLTKMMEVVEEEEAKARGEEEVAGLEVELKLAQEKLDEVVNQEAKAKDDLAELGDVDENQETEKEDDPEKAKARQRLHEHLETIKDLVQERAERVASLSSRLKSQSPASSKPSSSASKVIAKKMCSSNLLSELEYRSLLSASTEDQHVKDISEYISLIAEGNEAILSKNNLSKKRRKRSRRFDRDYYRTCVGEGLRCVAYKYNLSPYLAGIKLEDTILQNGKFDYDKSLAGEEDEIIDPRRWEPPSVSVSPTDFANELVGSGELVLLASTQKGMAGNELKDPLKGCRYVAAMELANEPRIKRHMRELYRKKAVLTTYPTAKGREEIDYFHEDYGLHLIRNKPIMDHFSDATNPEGQWGMNQLSIEERKNAEDESLKNERESCLQYLRLLKSEATKNIKIKIHLPSRNRQDIPDDQWYTTSNLKKLRPDLTPFLNELQKIYLPFSNNQTNDNMDTGVETEWNNERTKILTLALTSFLLPQFETEIKKQLHKAAIHHGVQTASSSLRRMAMEGPYRPHHLAGDNRFLHPTSSLPIVGVSVPTTDGEATYLVSVNPWGEVQDKIAIPAGCRVDSRDIPDQLQTFFMLQRPAAVLVGVGGGLTSRFLARRLGDVLHRAMEKWNNRGIQKEDDDDMDFERRRLSFEKQHNLDNDDDDGRAWRCNV
mmetsp:Transcript_60513/g.71871  ORF Transcript_60513/g.71871 Transcript_60513/m.71871 type:complete len:1119 (-) Transcript_60513:52-3408(-)